MTIKQAKEKVSALANKIDETLQKLEELGRDDTEKYHHLFYISSGLHDLVDSEF